MADNEVLVSVEISHRTHQIQVTTMMRGKGRHNHYASLQQAPETVRGEALVLIREALQRAGYDSLTELETALEAGPVTPEADEGAEQEADVAPLPPTLKVKADKTWGDEEIPLEDDRFEIGGG
jgi:hypothetical protein